MRSLVLTAAFIALSACTTPQAITSCAGIQMTETQLFFGLSRPSGPSISDAEFGTFVNKEVAPRFPEGFTLVNATGQWQDTTTKRPVAEKSRVLVRLHNNTPADNSAITAVTETYRKHFDQQSVLRVDTPACATF